MDGDFELWIALALFVLYVIFDGMFAYYTLAVMRLWASRAALSSMVVILISAFGVINYVKNGFYLIPIVLGCGVGTYLVVWLEKRKKTKA